MHAFAVVTAGLPVAYIIEHSFARAEIVAGSDIFRQMLKKRWQNGCPSWNGEAALAIRDASPAETVEAQLGMAQMRISDPEAPEGAGATMFIGSVR